MNFIYRPSTTTSSSHEEGGNDFIYAEELGKSEKNCENVFHRCTFPLLDIISVIY
jgi:hypothetical protein